MQYRPVLTAEAWAKEPQCMRDFCTHMQTLLFTGWAGQNLQDQVSFQSHCSTQQRWSTTQGSRRTNMPKAKKHLMPIENSRPARPTMAKASASKSHCDGLCLLVCAFSKKPCRQAIQTDKRNLKCMQCKQWLSAYRNMPALRMHAAQWLPCYW